MELSQIPAALQSRLRLSVIAALLSGPKKFRTLQDLTGAPPPGACTLAQLPAREDTDTRQGSEKTETAEVSSGVR